MPRTQIFSTGFHHCRGKVIHRLLRGTSNSSPRRRMNNFGNRIREQRTDKEMRHQRAGSETGAPIARFGGTARIVWRILSPSLADSRRGEGETLPASCHGQPLMFASHSTGGHFRCAWKCLCKLVTVEIFAQSWFYMISMNIKPLVVL